MRRVAARVRILAQDGEVDLNVGLTPHGSKEYSVTSPPAILGDTVIVGALVADSFRKGVPAGVVRAFDARSGALRWAWNAVPPGETDVNPDGTYRAGTPNVWSIISVDPARNLVFLPTGNAGNDYFGADREGLDYYSSSVVALDGATGKVVWHFQAVHHDLWDYDMPAQPTLTRSDDQRRERSGAGRSHQDGLHVRAQSRNGRAALSSRGEACAAGRRGAGGTSERNAARTSLPAANGPNAADCRMMRGASHSGTRASVATTLKGLRTGDIYQPPSLQGSVINPSTFGGNDWGSPAIDPVSKRMVVATTHVALSVKLVPRAQCGPLNPDLPQTGSAYCAVVVPVLSPWGAPCTKPPWATLDAVDLSSGKIAWTRPLGELGPAAKWPLSKMDGAAFSIGGPLITATGLIFIGAGTDPAFRAYDLSTGKELWKGTLPTTANSVPMSYRLGDNGRQFVVVAAGGHFALSGMAPRGRLPDGVRAADGVM